MEEKQRQFRPDQTNSTLKSNQIRHSTTGRFHVTNNQTTIEQKELRSNGTEIKNVQTKPNRYY